MEHHSINCTHRVRSIWSGGYLSRREKLEKEYISFETRAVSLKMSALVSEQKYCLLVNSFFASTINSKREIYKRISCQIYVLLLLWHRGKMSFFVNTRHQQKFITTAQADILGNSVQAKYLKNILKKFINKDTQTNVCHVWQYIQVFVYNL